MTTGEKFQFRGLSAANRVLLLAKEIELIDLEMRGHREVVIQLHAVRDMALLTVQQARGVRDELDWRVNELRRLTAARRLKAVSIKHWAAKQNKARERTSAHLVAQEGAAA